MNTYYRKEIASHLIPFEGTDYPKEILQGHRLVLKLKRPQAMSPSYIDVTSKVTFYNFHSKWHGVTGASFELYWLGTQYIPKPRKSANYPLRRKKIPQSSLKAGIAFAYVGRKFLVLACIVVLGISTAFNGLEDAIVHTISTFCGGLIFLWVLLSFFYYISKQ